MSLLWQQCKAKLEEELTPQQFNTWVRPLTAIATAEDVLEIRSPNKFVLDWVRERYWTRIVELLDEFSGKTVTATMIVAAASLADVTDVGTRVVQEKAPASTKASPSRRIPTTVRKEFTFENFVEGKSNQLARAASIQIAENPGKSYNPLFICGGVGLGKTHLMHAVGNHLLSKNPTARVAYLHSERFVADMVRALQHNTITDPKVIRQK